MRDRADARDVEHVQAGVAERLAEQQFRVGADRGAPCVDVARLDERGLDAEARQRVVQQIVAAAVERAGGHHVRAGTGQRGDRQMQGGLAAGGGDRADAALQCGDAFLEHRIGRVADAAVDVARALHVEQRCRVVAVLEHERGAQMYRYCACTGCGVGCGSGMQSQGVESRIAVAGHVSRRRAAPKPTAPPWG